MSFDACILDIDPDAPHAMCDGAALSVALRGQSASCNASRGHSVWVASCRPCQEATLTSRFAMPRLWQYSMAVISCWNSGRAASSDMPPPCRTQHSRQHRRVVRGVPGVQGSSDSRAMQRKTKRRGRNLQLFPAHETLYTSCDGCQQWMNRFAKSTLRLQGFPRHQARIRGRLYTPAGRSGTQRSGSGPRRRRAPRQSPGWWASGTPPADNIIQRNQHREPLRC